MSGISILSGLARSAKRKERERWCIQDKERRTGQGIVCCRRMTQRNAKYSLPALHGQQLTDRESVATYAGNTKPIYQERAETMYPGIVESDHVSCRTDRQSSQPTLPIRPLKPTFEDTSHSSYWPLVFPHVAPRPSSASFPRATSDHTARMYTYPSWCCIRVAIV
jgi:hypothetical protein